MTWSPSVGSQSLVEIAGLAEVNRCASLGVIQIALFDHRINHPMVATLHPIRHATLHPGQGIFEDRRTTLAVLVVNARKPIFPRPKRLEEMLLL
jgi:hypothetical protein